MLLALLSYNFILFVWTQWKTFIQTLIWQGPTYASDMILSFISNQWHRSWTCFVVVNLPRSLFYSLLSLHPISSIMWTHGFVEINFCLSTSNTNSQESMMFSLILLLFKSFFKQKSRFYFTRSNDVKASVIIIIINALLRPTAEHWSSEYERFGTLAKCRLAGLSIPSRTIC